MDPVALRYDQRHDELKLRSRLDELAARWQPVEVWLYGSRARGTYVDSSDWDLVLVSPVFEGVPFVRRAAEAAWELSQAGAGPVDVLCYTPEEWSRKRSGGPLEGAFRSARRLYPRG